MGNYFFKSTDRSCKSHTSNIYLLTDSKDSLESVHCKLKGFHFFLWNDDSYLKPSFVSKHKAPRSGWTFSSSILKRTSPWELRTLFGPFRWSVHFFHVCWQKSFFTFKRPGWWWNLSSFWSLDRWWRSPWLYLGGEVSNSHLVIVNGEFLQHSLSLLLAVTEVACGDSKNCKCV